MENLWISNNFNQSRLGSSNPTSPTRDHPTCNEIAGCQLVDLGCRRYGGLFDCQNEIYKPSTYAEDAAPAYGAGGDLAVCALADREGVTNFGFALDDADGAVYVCGDWLDSYGPWRHPGGVSQELSDEPEAGCPFIRSAPGF